MTKKFFLSLREKVKTGYWSLSQKNRLEKIFFYSTVLFLPTQLGLHFWPDYSYVYGIRIDYLSPTIFFTDILILCLFLSTLFKKDFWQFNKLFLLTTAVFIVSIFFAINWQEGVYGLIKFFEFSFFAFYLLKRIKNFKLAFTLLSISAIFESLLAIWQFLNKGSIGSLLYYLGERSFNGQTPGIANASIGGNLILRPYATFPHPNVLAGFLLIVITITLFSVKKLKVINFLSLSICSIALLLTLSRSVILVFIFLVIFKVFLSFKTKSLKKIIPALGIIGVCLYFLFFSQYSARFSSLSLNDTSIIERQKLANAAILMFQKNPLLGVGLNNFLSNLPLFLSQKNYLLIQPVHNIYLLVLSELGIIGFFFFLILLFFSLRTILKNKNLVVAVLLFEVLFLGLFDHYFLTLQQGQLLFALIIGLSFSKKLLI